MTYDEVLTHFGSQKAVADALDLSQPSISDWRRLGSIPHIRQLQLEHLTGGVLKADELELPRKLADRGVGA